MDNLGAHRAVGVREAIHEAGARVLYLPPYHPELNPIELAWSKLKALLKRPGLETSGPSPSLSRQREASCRRTTWPAGLAILPIQPRLNAPDHGHQSARLASPR
jgi:hypothetical protein